MPYMDNSNAERLVNSYSDMILRVSFLYLKQTCDAEDVSLPDKAEAEDNLVDKELIEALQMLPLNYRISLFLFYYEGYKVKEIAEILGKNENTVSAYLSRGRKKLKRILHENQGGRTFIVGA